MGKFVGKNCRVYWSFAYSALARFRIGISGLTVTSVTRLSAHAQVRSPIMPQYAR